ncbi:CpaF family protein [Lacipirellula parvula]|uniref:ATP hydrolase n=1 Tax=Lacipirellula parvula TaxID=2650471 RepID=A0A5K7XAV9_9BACT|nr:CpaF family protein [Lacipirellula parvula]BBO33082.1 ATP hydrolase [Lacipirellula parvula]
MLGAKCDLPTPTTTNDQQQPWHQLKVELHEQLISGMDFDVLRSVDPERLRAEIRRGAEELCSLHADLLTRAERNQLIEELVDETLGLGPLETLMHDPTVSDILINGAKCVYVERRGKLERVPVQFRDLDHLIGIVQRIAGRVGRRIDESSPMVDARLPDGSRLNAVIKPLALDGALVSIRRFPSKPMTTGELLQRRAAAPEMLDLLAACARARLNIMISGGTGSGKTTLLNVLSSFISQNERIATIEDAAELQLQQPHVARMETRPANLEGNGAVTARDLLRNALRMRPDRIIVGECRGAEAFDMLQAMNTGHEGGMTTIHANETRDALSRLEMLVGMAAPELPMWFIHRQIASAIHIIVQVARMSDGSRKITQISEITGMNGNTINMHDLFVFKQTGVDAQGQVVGQFHTTGIPPQCAERLSRYGLQAPIAEQRPLDAADRLQSLRIR